MLVIGRWPNESLVITVPPSTTETKIEIKIVRVRGHNVRLGVVAPREVRALREELVGKERAPSP